MTFDELNTFLPIRSQEGFICFLDAAFAYRLKNKEHSGELATFIYNKTMGFLNQNKNNLDPQKYEMLERISKSFIYLDYIPYDDSKSDLEYEKKVDDAWDEVYEMFIKVKNKTKKTSKESLSDSKNTSKLKSIIFFNQHRP